MEAILNWIVSEYNTTFHNISVISVSYFGGINRRMRRNLTFIDLKKMSKLDKLRSLRQIFLFSIEQHLVYTVICKDRGVNYIYTCMSM
jgi:hypothetical protein